MFCQKCGNSIPDGLYVCPNCGSLANSAPVQPLLQTVKIKSYMVEAILIIVFCCVPFGIVALVYACHVNGYLENNDIVRAQYASDKARTWVLLGLTCGFVGTLLYAILVAIA